MTPRLFALQARDLDILRSLALYRLLTSEHVHVLHFGGLSLRMCNRRLHALGRRGLLLRRHLPDFHNAGLLPSRRPLYGISPLGAEVLAEAGIRDEVAPVPCLRVGQLGVLLHNLVATDWMVAVGGALRSAGYEVTPHPESVLRQALRHGRQQSGNRFPIGILPDAALTGTHSGHSACVCLEVVRAGVRGGNRTLREKMQRYNELNRAGFFRSVYGFERLRAVILLTPSSVRAGHYQALAAGLQHGSGLFYATSYERRADFGMTLRPEALPKVLAADGALVEHLSFFTLT